MKIDQSDKICQYWQPDYEALGEQYWVCKNEVVQKTDMKRENKRFCPHWGICRYFEKEHTIESLLQMYPESEVSNVAKKAIIRFYNEQIDKLRKPMPS